MSLFNSMNISATGLTSQRLRMDIISQNIANVSTTRTADGTPYRRQTAIFETNAPVTMPFSAHFSDAVSNTNIGGGVRVSRIETDFRRGDMVYDPNHPHADEYGYVEMPNVNIVEEMVNMISASRSYEANITAIGVTRAMITKTLEIGASR